MYAVVKLKPNFGVKVYIKSTLNLSLLVCNKNGIMDNYELGVDCDGGGCPLCRKF